MIHTRWFEIDSAMAAYVVGYLAVTIFALAHLWFQRAEYAREYAGYCAFLCVPWKLITFTIATVVMTLVAPYTGDPTWDYVDTPMMAVLTGLTAPWVLGVLWQARRRPKSHVLVALCLWMLSSSWCYDVYQLFKLGMYPPTWWSNIVASAVLYISAGLMWNLDVRPNRGATFAFLEPVWLQASAPGVTLKILLYAAPFMALVAASIAYFLF